MEGQRHPLAAALSEIKLECHQAAVVLIYR